MRNTDKSTRIKEIAKKDNLPLEVLQLNVKDDKSVADAISMIGNRQQRIDVLVNRSTSDILILDLIWITIMGIGYHPAMYFTF